MQPELFDVIELLVDLPAYTLRSGARGAIVHCYADGAYEVEFANADGETVALCPLAKDQFIVVWRAQTRTWLPVAEQIASLITHLPEEARLEVLDFTRVLHEQRTKRQEKTAKAPEPFRS
jgi:hypothetical protein